MTIVHKSLESSHIISETAWLFILSDLLTLLLTFFVMRLAMTSSEIHPIPLPDRPFSQPNTNVMDYELEIRDIIGKYPDVTLTSLSLAGRQGFVVRLGEGLFLKHSDQLPLRTKELIAEMVRVIQRKKFSVVVRGFTDSTIVLDSFKRSPWDRSINETLAVVRQMIDAGLSPSVISAAAFADQNPVADEQTTLGRHLNRRIELQLYFAKTTQQLG